VRNRIIFKKNVIMDSENIYNIEEKVEFDRIMKYI
jgi:hypothetical protein